MYMNSTCVEGTDYLSTFQEMIDTEAMNQDRNVLQNAFFSERKLEQWRYQVERLKEKELMKWQKCPTQRSSGWCLNGALALNSVNIRILWWKGSEDRLKSYAKKVVIPQTYLLTDVNTSMKTRRKKCHYYVICIRVVSLWINTLKSRANFSNANVSLTTRVLDTNALNWIAVRTAVQDSQILVLEVMKDKINFFVIVVGCFFSCSRESWCILIPRLLSLVRDIKIAFCCAYQLDVRLDL